MVSRPSLNNNILPSSRWLLLPVFPSSIASVGRDGEMDGSVGEES